MEHSHEDDWVCQMEMDVHDVRALYEVICYAIETWPGSPRRPREEQVYLKHLRSQLFAMLADYSFTRPDKS